MGNLSCAVGSSPEELALLKSQFEEEQRQVQEHNQELEKKIEVISKEKSEIETQKNTFAEKSQVLQAERDELEKNKSGLEERLAQREKELADLKEKLGPFDVLSKEVGDLMPLAEPEDQDRRLEIMTQAVKRFKRFKETGIEPMDPLDVKDREVQTVLKELFMFQIRISGAVNIPNGPNGNKRHVYCVMSIDEEAKRTRIVYSNEGQVHWPDQFRLILDTKPASFKLELWDYDEVKDDGGELLGSYVYPLDKFYQFDGVVDISEDVKLQSDIYPSTAIVSLEISCRIAPQTILRWVSGYDNEKIARLLQFVGVSLDKYNPLGRTYLINAVVENQPNAVRTYLCAGANPDLPEQTETKLTPLMYAAIYGFTDVARVLIDDGKAAIDLADPLGRTALMFAAKNGRVDCARFLLERSPNVNASDRDGLTALMMAVVEGHHEMTELLLNNGAFVDQQTAKKMTALHIAAVRGHAKCAQVLLEKSADTEIKDSNGLTALLIASINNQVEVVRLLVQYGANLEAQESHGRTALMYAAFQNRILVIKELLKSKAMLGAMDCDGRTATSIAKDSNHEDVYQLLSKFAKVRK